MSGNVTVSVCNEASVLFAAKVSGTGRLAAAGLCGFEKVGKERNAAAGKDKEGRKWRK